MKEPLNKQEWLGMSFALIGLVSCSPPDLFNTIIKRFCLDDNLRSGALYTLG